MLVLQDIIQNPLARLRAHAVEHWINNCKLDVAVMFEESVAFTEEGKPVGFFDVAGYCS